MSPVITDLPTLPGAGVATAPPRLQECGRYQLGDRTRVLCTHVANGQTVLLDMPGVQFDAGEQNWSAESYLVEADLSFSDAELRALVEDYRQQALIHQRVPMSVPLLGDSFPGPLL